MKHTLQKCFVYVEFLFL